MHFAYIVIQGMITVKYDIDNLDQEKYCIRL